MECRSCDSAYAAFQTSKGQATRGCLCLQGALRALTSGPLWGSLPAASALHKRAPTNTQNPDGINDHRYFGDT